MMVWPAAMVVGSETRLARGKMPNTGCVSRRPENLYLVDTILGKFGAVFPILLLGAVFAISMCTGLFMY